MPKDPPRNQPNYKIGGYHLNEYEFTQHEGAMTEEERERFEQRRGGDAEQDSAAAMDADVPQPPDESQADKDQSV